MPHFSHTFIEFSPEFDLAFNVIFELQVTWLTQAGDRHSSGVGAQIDLTGMWRNVENFRSRCVRAVMEFIRSQPGPNRF